MLVAVGLVAVAGFFVYITMHNEKPAASTSQQDSGAVALQPTTNANDAISLSSKSTGQKDPNALAVNDAQSTSANLGSGTRGATTTNTNSSNTQDFSQYEQYKDKNEVYFADLVVGSGAEAVKDAQLAVTYKGYLTNGQVFDQSRSGNNGQLQPLLFTLGAGQLIPGFEQGVVGMKVGGSRRVIIPPALGYGANAQGSIPANSVLVFDVQLTAAQ